MKEELQNKLVEILTGIQSAVGKASDFAMEQLPDIAMQFIRFKTVWYSIEALILALVIWWSIALSNRFFRRAGNDGDFWFLGFCVRVLVFVEFLFFIHDLYQLVMIWVAPKIWFIYQIIDMVKEIK